MPSHPLLIRRGSTFWHRAAVPVDIKATYPKVEETFSLRTKDPKEAMVLVRKAAAEVDERFAAHRRRIASLEAAALKELSGEHLDRGGVGGSAWPELVKLETGMSNGVEL